MKQYLLIQTMVLLSSVNLLGQPRSMKDTVAVYFNEIEIVTQENKNLWNYDLYAPILLVRPDTRETYANFPDTAGTLKKDGSVFTGFLPKTVNIANTSIEWNGVRWAMVMLPLPDNKNDRSNLLAHELFHRAQPHLGFALSNTGNNHLDQKEGRIYLRLELEALKAALLVSSHEEVKQHLTNALAFRKYRHALYPKADSTENLLELNEGIAEYTGIMMSGRNKEQMQNHFVKVLKQFLTNPTFVRSFAYQTTPLYGYLLHHIQNGWNKDITAKTNLTEHFLKALTIQLPKDLKSFVTANAAQYAGPTIIAEETARDAEVKRLVGEYKYKFIEQPHLEVSLQNMNISFDPRNIMPLEEKGTVYPNVRVTDNWGILTVTNGALMSPNWNKITVSIPTQIDDDKAVGDGWTLELKNGFVVRKDRATNNYFLTKK